MKRILGMAKRHLDLRGAKAPKLELDFLRLVYAVQLLRTGSDQAQGYLLVLSPQIRDRALLWRDKYQAADAVQVLWAPMTDAEQDEVLREIEANRAGMIAGTMGQKVDGRSGADRGGAIAEAHLAALIQELEPGVVRLTDHYPLRIRWDYYGTVDTR